MKTYIPYSLILAVAASGLAMAADTAYTTPVGYETLPVATGFNYLGLRLQQPVVASGTLETVAAGSVTDTGATFSFAASETYILEINNGSGLLTEFQGSAASGATITTTDNLSAAGVANGASYKIRKASTLTSVFGANNSAGLASGFGGIGGADVVFISKGNGTFDQFYYDELEGSWADVNGAVVVGTQIPIVYTDSLIVSSTTARSLVVTGEVKTTPTSVAAPSGFNYIGSVYPAGATLSSTFNAAIPNLTTGFGGIGGADVFFVSNGTGGFNQFYYDELESSWADVNGAPVDGATINLESGVIFSNEGAAVNLKLSPPASYSNL